jgi:hypothetical protein
MVERGAHHIKAPCVVAAKLAERFWTVEARGEPSVVRDVDGRPVDPEEARRVIAERTPCPNRSAAGAAPPSPRGRPLSKSWTDMQHVARAAPDRSDLPHTDPRPGL